MDFTSDSRQSTTTNGADDSSNESEIALNNDELKLIDLQNDKERLIAQRNLLLAEIDHYNTQIESPITFQNNISLPSLLDTLKTNDNARILNIDGNSDPSLELASKYDTMPLLNMDKRLDHIQNILFPNVTLSLNDDKLVATYSLLEPYFTIEIRLKYANETLTHCEVTNVSDEVKWHLKSLISSKNPSKILLGCFEFDRLRFRITNLMNSLLNDFSSNNQITVLKDQFSIELSSKKNIKLKIMFHIGFNKESILPTTTIVSQLFKNGMYIDIDDIKFGLIKEYGINVGLSHLCNVCLN